MLELLSAALPELIAMTPVLLLGLLPAALLIGLALAMRNATQVRRAVRAMGEDCDPEPLLALATKTLRRYGENRNPRYRNILFSAHVNAATALYNLGRFEEALAHLDRPGLEDYPLPSQAVCLLNRAAVYCDTDRPREMAGALAQAEELIRDSAFPREQRRAFEDICYSDHLALEMLEKGPSPELENAYRALLAQAGGESQRVGIHLQLARCALAREDEAAAREQLEYVLAHGGKLFFRRRAEEMLKTLDGPAIS